MNHIYLSTKNNTKNISSYNPKEECVEITFIKKSFSWLIENNLPNDNLIKKITHQKQY